MALHLIGIGLRDPTDITVKGFNAVKASEQVFLESYTSLLSCSKEELEQFYGKTIRLAPRGLVESEIEDTILLPAKEKDIALLIIGDPFGATTHADILLRAKELGVETNIIHNASVMTAIGITGLQLYKFGKTTSIPYDNENVTTPIEMLKKNQSVGLHTLMLLDLRPDENRFMSIKEAIDYLISKDTPADIFAVGCAGLGDKNAQIRTGSLAELKEKEFSVFPQCLIIPGDMHFMEEDALKMWTFQ
ncbi:diphthine synthase [Candidatus Woesearchaeota archaeon]|nr:diphthine synthase [Candidatus Woesearchaeota archaeon]